jgi:hypothetical protein
LVKAQVFDVRSRSSDQNTLCAGSEQPVQSGADQGGSNPIAPFRVHDSNRSDPGRLSGYHLNVSDDCRESTGHEYITEFDVPVQF